MTALRDRVQIRPDLGPQSLAYRDPAEPICPKCKQPVGKGTPAVRVQSGVLTRICHKECAL